MSDWNSPEGEIADACVTAAMRALPRPAKKRVLLAKTAYVAMVAQAIAPLLDAVQQAPAAAAASEDEAWVPFEDPEVELPAPAVYMDAQAPKHATTILKPLWPEGLPLEERSFKIPVSSLPKLQAIAEEHRVGIEVIPLDARRYATILRDRAAAGALGHDLYPISMFMPAAERLAASYVTINLSFPRVDNTVIATAEAMQEGNVLKGDGYWTRERIADLDFGRCDRCNIRHSRKFLYIVSTPTGEVLQVGGQCADLMNLGKLLKQTLHGIEQIIREIQKLRDDDLLLDGSGAARKSWWVLPTYLAVLDQWLQYQPYMSGSKHYEMYGQRGGTAYDVLGVVAPEDYGGASKRSRAAVAAIQQAYAGSPRMAWLLQVIAQETAKKQASESGDDAMHGNNMALAAATGRMPGYLAAAIHRADKASADLRGWLEAPPVLRGFSAGNDLKAIKVASNSFEDAEALARSMRMTLDELAAAYDVDAEKVSAARAKNKPFPVPFKALYGAIPVLWVVADAFAFDGAYGTSYMARLVEITTKRYLLATGTGAADWKRGQVLRILRATEARESPARSDRSGFRWPTTTQVNRVDAQVAEGVPAPTAGEGPPPRPVIPEARDAWGGGGGHG